MTTQPRRTLALLAGSLLLTFSLTGVATAQTPAETGDYSGSAGSSVLEVDALTVPDTFQLLDSAVAPTSTAADTTGGLEHAGESGLTAFGTGTNAGLTLAGELEVDGLLVEATQTAPPDNEEPTSETLAQIPADPLLEADVASAEALARDVGTVACPTNNVLSYGQSQVANAQLLPDALDPGDVVDLDGVVETLSELSLTDVDGQDTLGVQAQAMASVASLELFDEIEINVASPPTLTAIAGGTPGSASVTYDAPAVTINGEGLSADETQELSIPPDAAPGEEDLLVRIAFGDLTQNVSDDGTSASASAALLQITVIDSPDNVTLADVALAPMNVEANAPDGGVACPAEAAPDDDLDVDVGGPDEVEAGEEFDYTIDVTNNLDCPVTNLVVVSEITGPDGTEITATDPEGDVDGLTVTWDDLDDLDPDETITFTITVSVPDDAETGVSLRNDVTATGDCDGDEVTGDGSFDGPVVSDGPDDGLAVDIDGPDEVQPGDEFDYTIDVTNNLECPIVDLVVVSEITGPDGTEITATDPEGDVDGLTVTWDGLEDLQPDDTATFTVTVSVPEDAEAGVNFRNDVTATGECDGEAVAGEGFLDGPMVADDGDTLPAADRRDPGDTRPASLPATGGGIGLLGLAALGLATALRRRHA